MSCKMKWVEFDTVMKLSKISVLKCQTSEPNYASFCLKGCRKKRNRGQKRVRNSHAYWPLHLPIFSVVFCTLYADKWPFKLLACSQLSVLDVLTSYLSVCLGCPARITLPFPRYIAHCPFLASTHLHDDLIYESLPHYQSAPSLPKCLIPNAEQTSAHINSTVIVFDNLAGGGSGGSSCQDEVSKDVQIRRTFQCQGEVRWMRLR